jgi:hypothetical protein
MITTRKSLAATVVVVIGVVLIGVVGVAQASHSYRAPRPIDFRRTETLAWSLELGPDSPDALHHVTCTRVTGDRYDCTGYDAADKTRTMHIRVSDSGAAWRSIDDTTTDR